MNGQPKKVECLSCKGHHLYRATQAQKEAMAAHKRASRGERSPVFTIMAVLGLVYLVTFTIIGHYAK